MSLPVTELRDRTARQAAAKQYRRAAGIHENTADDFMTRGYFEWAGDELLRADLCRQEAADADPEPTT